MRPVTRYTLIATKVAPAGMAQGRVPDFAGAIPPTGYTDPGRQWAGDPYTTGPVTDPTEAFAHFSGGEDTEAWLDRQDDGTVIGWVRTGKDVWRYTDPHTWGEDVDAAQMERVDAPSLGEELSAVVDPAAPADDTAEPADQAAADQSPDTPAAPETTDPAADPATDPAAATDSVPDEENPFLADDSETTDAIASTVNDTDAVEQAAEPGQTPLPQDPNLPAPADAAAPDPAPDPAPDTLPDPTDPEVDPKSRDLPWAKTQKKHLPGHHDQREHGNWAHGIHVNHTHAPDGTAIALPTGGGGSPKAPEPAAPAPAKQAPAKASVSGDALEHLSVENLEGIWASGEKLYDQDTLMKVADLLDQKNPLDAKMRTDTPHDLAGETGAFAAVIPDHYVAWVARNNPHAPKPATRNKRAQIEDAYQHFVDAQYAQATAATKGVLLSKAGKAARKDPMALFDGRLNRAQVRKFASEELLRWFKEHPHMTFQEFASEFYDSYAKATAHLKHAYLSEHG